LRRGVFAGDDGFEDADDGGGKVADENGEKIEPARVKAFPGAAMHRSLAWVRS
jgi:hypothetical protein